MILGSAEGVRNTGRSAVDESERGSTDVELGKLVEFGVDLVLRAALALGFDLLGLFLG